MTTPRDEYGKSAPIPFLKAIQIIIQTLAVLVTLGGLLFIPAGRLDWIDAWAYLIGYGLFLLAYAAWGLFRDPGQLRERNLANSAKTSKPWDRVILSIYTIFLLALFVVCGLDAGRFQSSIVPAPVKGIAWCGVAGAGAFIFWTLTTNTFLARVARIQSDRGQVVITSGPYRFLRHPMYLGIIILFFSTPLALGSVWGLIPGTIIGFLFILRTAREDRMLKEELAGYSEYSRRVRYRLIPGIW